MKGLDGEADLNQHVDEQARAKENPIDGEGCHLCEGARNAV